MKYSKGFNETYEFYHRVRRVFNFDGSSDIKKLNSFFSKRVKIHRLNNETGESEIIHDISFATFEKTYPYLDFTKYTLPEPIIGMLYSYSFEAYAEQLIEWKIDGCDAKEAFFKIDTYGRSVQTRHPIIVASLLVTKGSINMHIKQWAESRLDGTLPLIELDYERANEVFHDAEPCYIIEWINGQPIKHRDIKTQYGLPNWVIDAVEGQVHKERKKAAP